MEARRGALISATDDATAIDFQTILRPDAIATRRQDADPALPEPERLRVANPGGRRRRGGGERLRRMTSRPSP